MDTENSPYTYQSGGNHYKDHFPFIQPLQFFIKNKIPFDAACVCKYALRHSNKDGIEDLRKAKQVLEAMAYDLYGEFL